MADAVVATTPTTDNHVVFRIHKERGIRAGVPLRANIWAEVCLRADAQWYIYIYIYIYFFVFC